MTANKSLAGEGNAGPDTAVQAKLDKGVIEALAAFRYVLRRFMRHSEERAQAAEVTPQQYQLMLAVHGQAGRDWANIGELAESLQITHHAAVGLVTRCERAKLVRRAPHPEDKRQQRVLLTDKGVVVTSRIACQNFGEMKDLMLSLEILMQHGAVTMPQAAAVVRAVETDRETEKEIERRPSVRLRRVLNRMRALGIVDTIAPILPAVLALSDGSYAMA